MRTLPHTHVLVVDDEEFYRRALERILTRVGHRVSTARDAREALGMIAAEPMDLVLCDVRMPGLSGLELVRQIQEMQPDLPCIVVTGYGSAERSLEALRAGAYWYLEKPFEQSSLDVVRRLVEQAIEHGRLKGRVRHLESELRSQYGFENIVGSSPALREVLDVVRRVAESDSTVLLTGESGTGKELIARAIHYASRRAERKLVTVNCGAIPEELLEAELFGHVKGAFTSAVADRPGRFTLADGGTLFLDEIGDMSANLQVKLLRALQERSFEPVGSSHTVDVDVRVVAATNQKLAEAVADGRFREDLFYRLHVIPIEVPPLRDRREDVPALVAHFLEQLAERSGRRSPVILPEALDRLCDHDWPGNVRQLENVVERLVVMSSEGAEIGIAQLPAELRGEGRARFGTAPRLTATGLPFNEVVDRFEADLILQALELTHWNKNQAARLLGLNRTTLIEKIRKKKLEPPGGAGEREAAADPPTDS